MSSYFCVVPLTNYFLQTDFYGIDIICVYLNINLDLLCCNSQSNKTHIYRIYIFINVNAHFVLGTIPLSPFWLVFIRGK